jgi:hypothetical protein
MPPLTARDLLDAWEAGTDQSSAQRALWLLKATSTHDESYAELAQLPIGQRDARLLSLYEQLFGSRLVSVADCPQCGERLQLTLTTADVLIASDTVSNTQSVTVEGYTVQYRLPNSTDLLALATCDSVEAGRALLLSRCVSSVQRDQVDQDVASLPASVITALTAHMADADPQADVQFDLNCPVCQHRWLAAFDVMAYLWSEIGRWASRVVRDVHVLASNYGWSESDILSMTAARRQMYLNLIYGA